jgi:superfamily II DNA/RNA helicase
MSKQHAPKSGAPKKARWSTAKKAQAKAGPKKAHRGQGKSYDDRPPRGPQRSDRPGRRDDRRDDRAPRSFDRRDERPARSFDRREERPARAPRGDFRRDERRDDRAPRSFDRRDDRAPRSFDRRDDRAPRSFDRREERPARAPRSDFRRDADYGKREQRPGRKWENAAPKPVVDEAPVPVSDDNGFAALGLPEPLVQRLARDGITTPFPIQNATIPDALAGRDVLGRGQTGSGKTLAFGLPTLTRLAASSRAVPRRPRALVLVPTRELAIQVSDALEPLVHVMGLRHKLVAGGMPYQPQLNALDRGVELLIATPGRLNDLIERGAVELSEIDIAILDEADHMAEMGFLPEITTILDLIPAGRQRLLFSATLDRGVDEVVRRYLVDPVTHSTNDATASVDTMDHHILLIDPMHKKTLLAQVASREGRTVVFVRTKLGADRVAEQLREQGVFAAALHGGLNQGARNRVLGAFRDGTLPVLVATDVAARGIHVDDVSVVLQADPPADHKDYLHRSGRTARAGERGTVVTLTLPHQRRGMERIAREAGVDVRPTRVTPGDAALMEATGAQVPTGVPVPPAQVRRLLEGEKRPYRGRPGGRPQGRGPRPQGRGARSRAPRD